MAEQMVKILGIETSCDDTAIAILEAKKGGKFPEFRILANIISSQEKIHKKYGGVYPTMAKREHQKNLVPVLKKAVEKAGLLKIREEQQTASSKLKKMEKILEREDVLYGQLAKFLQKYQRPNIAFISVTSGPGLDPALWAGVNFARALSYFWDMPLVPTDHLEGHILINFINSADCQFPAIGLIVSGGHTQLVFMKKIGGYKIIGETRDDAAGECFDKTARVLGLGFPGGPEIAAEAAKFSASDPRFSIKLPRPMINTKDYDFSFSGLKTAALYDYQKRAEKERRSKEYIRAMSAEIQQAIIDVLIKKTMKAAKEFGVKTVILGGGVAANEQLQTQLKDACRKAGIKYAAPERGLATDNGSMIAVAGYFNWLKGKTKEWQEVEANANLRLEYTK